MPKIIVANNDNANMLSDQASVDRNYCLGSAIGSARLGWLAHPGDIVVLPRAPSEEMQRYIAESCGLEPGEVSYIAAFDDADKIRPLGYEELNDQALIAKLTRLIDDGDNWSVWAYYSDRSAVNFAKRLGVPFDQQSCKFRDEGGAELLNDKRIFRPLAAARGINLAVGEVCLGKAELERAVFRLIQDTGSVIVKQDRHSGTGGNVVVSKSLDEIGRGAASVICTQKVGGLEAAIDAVWSTLAYHESAPLIVESYYDTKYDMYAEFHIDAASRAVKFLNWGEQRMEPTFKGFFIPPSLPPYIAASFIAGASDLARLCCDTGFSGLMDVDAIATSDGRIVFNEINGRAGGCTHIHEICERLVGPNYGNEVVVCAHNRIASKSISTVLDVLTSQKLAYDKSTKTGIVVTSEDSQYLNVIEFLSIAPTRAAAMALELEFEALIKPH